MNHLDGWMSDVVTMAVMAPENIGHLHCWTVELSRDQIDNQAIVIPENIDAIRALAGREQSAQASIERTDGTPGARQRFV